MQDFSLIGQAPATLLHWLSETWLKEGPPVCFLEGFPGVGKNCVSNAFEKKAAAQNWLVARATLLEESSSLVDDLLLELATNLDLQGCDALAKAVDTGTSLETTLITLLVRQRVIVIFDEFQWGLAGSNQQPLPALKSILSRLANQPSARGRLLLLSHRLIERAKWSDPYAIKTLPPLQVSEAEQLLDHHLQESNQSDEVPAERRRDVVNWLGCNPRAITVFVGALKYESLDELIGRMPELWQLEDQVVSPELVAQLERSILEQTLNRIDPETQRFLSQLSLYRRDFTKRAIEIAAGGDKTKASQQRIELVNRFLMNHRQKYFSLHPIAREIARHRLASTPDVLKTAHAIAAQYYTRHFTARQMVDNGRLSSHFVEARYHLTRAGKEVELGQIIRGFEAHLKSNFTPVSPVPKDRDELNERIAVLAALLEKEGSTGLEYYLARLLQARGNEGDLRIALRHAHRSLGSQSSGHNWVLCAKLEHQVNGIDEAIKLLKQGITCVPVEKGLVDLYRSCGELLARVKRENEAIALLRQGIERIPADKSLFALYQSCGELLARANREDEAIALLRQGIERIPADKNLFALYQSCGELLARANREDEAIALLRQGIERIPADKSVVSLYQSCGELLAQVDRDDEAIALLRQGIEHIPADKSLFTLYQSCGELLARVKREDEAIALLRQGIERIPADKSLFTLYQAQTKILSRSGKTVQAVDILREGFRTIPPAHGGSRLADLALYLSLQIPGREQLSDLLLELERGGGYRQQVYLGKILLAEVNQDWAAGLHIAEEGLQAYPTNVALMSQKAFCHLCLEDLGAARETLEAPYLRLDRGNVAVWLRALVELKSGHLAAAQVSLAAFLGQSLDPAMLTEAYLLALWDNEYDLGFENMLSLYFPFLPSSITGLSATVSRQQYESPVLPPQTKAMPQRNQVFISYSHQDRAWLERLQKMLKPLTRNKNLCVWDDTQIKPGDKWRNEINSALELAKVAVLLVSADFLNSDFIEKHELPPLLEAAEKEGLTVLWVYLDYCLYDETIIGEYQAAHKPLQPLAGLNPVEQNQKLAEICRMIKAATEDPI